MSCDGMSKGGSLPRRPRRRAKIAGHGARARRRARRPDPRPRRRARSSRSAATRAALVQRGTRRAPGRQRFRADDRRRGRDRGRRKNPGLPPRRRRPPTSATCAGRSSRRAAGASSSRPSAGAPTTRSGPSSSPCPRPRGSGPTRPARSVTTSRPSWPSTRERGTDRRDVPRRAAPVQLHDRRGPGLARGDRHRSGRRARAHPAGARVGEARARGARPHARAPRPHHRLARGQGSHGGADPPPPGRPAALRRAARAGRLLRPARRGAAAAGCAARRRRADPLRARTRCAPSTRRDTRRARRASCSRATSPILFAGDTLFRRSIGRTDLWGGDTDTILASIREKLFTLPGDAPVVCGHGPGTTIDEEKRLNPFAGL